MTDKQNIAADDWCFCPNRFRVFRLTDRIPHGMPQEELQKLVDGLAELDAIEDGQRISSSNDETF